MTETAQDRYPLGATVVFGDKGVLSSEATLTTGTVNDAPITDADSELVYVPVWVPVPSRLDGGRTLLVAEKNILEVTP